MHITLTLQQNQNIPVPQIINKGELDNNSFLLLEFIENGHAYPESYRKLGKIVANMHKKVLLQSKKI